MSTEADKSLPNTNKPTHPRLAGIKASTPKHAAAVEKSKRVAFSKKLVSQSIHSERTQILLHHKKRKCLCLLPCWRSRKNENVFQGQLHRRASRSLSKTLTLLSASPLRSTARRGSRSPPAESTTSQLASDVCYVIRDQKKQFIGKDTVDISSYRIVSRKTVIVKPR